MVALGCKYLRICHLNNCATGVATQDEKLRREHFTGLPEMVMNYFQFIAQETRELMAQLGVTQLTDLIGRTDLLQALPGLTARQAKLDLSGILASPVAPAIRAAASGPAPPPVTTVATMAPTIMIVVVTASAHSSMLLA